jgi:hypothetical protein
MLCHVSSVYVWLGQLKSEYVRIVELSQVVSCQGRSGKFGLCQVLPGLVRLGQVLSR